jgi:UDP-N-acetylglucosamine 2-epimerase
MTEKLKHKHPKNKKLINSQKKVILTSSHPIFNLPNTIKQMTEKLKHKHP